jgi:hypothetical protein
MDEKYKTMDVNSGSEIEMSKHALYNSRYVFYFNKTNCIHKMECI